MFSKVRKRVTYTNVALTLVLVFAMSGGAYAASKYVITSTKQISPKVLKSLTGKTGAKGATGPAGTQGSAGAAGPQGPAGNAGGPGTNGEKGEKGETGEKGPKGTAGSPWTAGGTLPHEATETGGWAVAVGDKTTVTGQDSERTAISFTIPLAKALDETHVVSNGVGEGETEDCPGTVEEPKAKAGFLCVYTGASEEMEFSAPISLTLSSEGIPKIVIGASTAGAVLIDNTKEKHGAAFANGSWATTGE